MIDYSLDSFTIQKQKDAYALKMRGWVFSQKYEIGICGDRKMLSRFQGNEQRYDVCFSHGVEVEDNQYGFDVSVSIPENIKLIHIYVFHNGRKIRIHSISLSGNYLVKIYSRICNFIDQAKKVIDNTIAQQSISGVIKKIIFRFKKGRNTSNHKEIFDPNNKDEYRKWLEKCSYKKPDGFDNITYYVSPENTANVRGKHVIRHTVFHLDSIDTDYVCFVGKDCHLYKQFYAYISECQKYDMLYFDHDHIDADGRRYKPVLKPDFSFDTLQSVNYIGNVFVVHRKMLKEFDGKQIENYEIVMQLARMTTRIGHISKVLYADNSISEVTNVERHLPHSKPLVSIVIPTKDHISDLQTCIDSIINKSTYQNYEIVVIDNASVLDESAVYFEDVQKNNKAVKVFRLECKFNYSYINNQAIQRFCNGDYILLLNNDTEVITPDWLEQMLFYAEKDDIGSVGALLYFPDHTIQHAGIIMGMGGVAGHAHYQKPMDSNDFGYEMKVPYNVSCCTAACLMFRKDHYEKVGGLNEELQVAFNDVDFGLKLLSEGYRNVFLPSVKLFHYESKSRGLENSAEKMKRYIQECEYMKQHWGKYIEKDPFYNENYSLQEDYKLQL